MGFRVLGTRLLDVEEEPLDVTAIRAEMLRLASGHQAAQKLRFDAKRIPGQQYAEGDLVLLRLTTVPNMGTSKKLLPKWRGPFRVNKVLENNRYEVIDIPGAVRSRIPYKGKAG